MPLSKNESPGSKVVWWPRLDVNIERKVNRYYTWQSPRTSPARAPLHPWEWPRKPWHWIHMDYTNYNSRNLLIVTNTHSKWIEVYFTGATNSTTTIEKLRCCLATHGLPNLLVSDNGPCFTSLEFAEFTRKNGIKHKLVSPYHQASNGQAESLVKIVKIELRRMSGGTLERKLSTVPTLLQDNTPYHNWSYTCRTADKKLQTSLDRLRPSTSTTVLLSQDTKFYHDRRRCFTKARRFLPRILTVASNGWPSMFWRVLMPYLSW